MARTVSTATKTQTRSRSNGSDASSQQERIAQLAYQFFVERGCLHGYDVEDWLRAEAAVNKKKS